MYNNYDASRVIEEDLVKESPFWQDYIRIEESIFFKSLVGKTQLISVPGPFYNRLIHTLEVSKVAILIADEVNKELELHNLDPVNKDIILASSLAHDIGHPPFGHVGERTLDTLMSKKGGFESNAQTIKLLTSFSLNSTNRTIAASLKYRTVIPEVREKYDGLIKGYYEYMSRDLAQLLETYTQDVIEKDIIDLADTLSYSISDLLDLIAFWGRDRLSRLVNEYYTYEALIEPVKTYFSHITINEIKQLLPRMIEEVKEDVLGKLLHSDSYKRKELQYLFLKELIHSVHIKMNIEHPKYSRLTLPFKVQLKIFLLLQLTHKCFLEREFNRELDGKIEDYIKRVFHYFYELDSCSLPSIMKMRGQKKSDEIERARNICDAICYLSDNQIVHLVDTKCYKSILI
ncbi:dGTP triphosphohydrolase [Bacillus cereus]|uniref:dGTP triphosphohydrolase n=1 Tax=Bacillus cereus TaxID=1396 RepID=UPI0018F684C2|nr:dNTP triphosphohydrolase [Bacillus cereus]MBJ7987095.1 dNTP triphosphohydrolase [Bacillus cereus]